MSLMMSVFSSLLRPWKIVFLFFFSVATFPLSFLLSLRLLSVFIKMKGSFDVRFWSPGWPKTTYPYRIDKYIKKEIWFQPILCFFYTDQSGEVLLHVDHQQLQLLSWGDGRGHQKLHFFLRSQWQTQMVSKVSSF